MIKVAMAIIITSMPNWPSVKYQGYLYPDMQTCLTSTEMYVEEFRAHADSQGNYDAYFNSICLFTFILFIVKFGIFLFLFI